LPIAAAGFDIFEGNWIMKTLVSLLIGGVLLFGAATFGTQAGTANGRDKHDKNYWKHHRHHRRHQRHRRHHDKLSY
jgi:hypothetical protein